MAGFAFDERIGEGLGVTGGFPDGGIHNDGGVQPDYIVSLVDHRFPPLFFDIVFELDSQRAIVPEALQTSVDFGARVHKSPSFTQANDFVHKVHMLIVHLVA